MINEELIEVGEVEIGSEPWYHLFSFKAFLITCLLAIAAALWMFDQKEAAVTVFTLFSSWGGSWLFTKEE